MLWPVGTAVKLLTLAADFFHESGEMTAMVSWYLTILDQNRRQSSAVSMTLPTLINAIGKCTRTYDVHIIEYTGIPTK